MSNQHIRVQIGFLVAVWLVIAPFATHLSAQSKTRGTRKKGVAADPTGLIHTFSGHDGPATAVAYSPTGKFLVSGGRDKTIRIWDIVKKKPSGEMGGLHAPISSVVVLPGGEFAASGGSNHDDLLLWDLNQGTVVRQFKGYGHGTAAVVVNRTGEILGAACADSTIHFWNTSTADKLASIDTQRNSRVIALSPDGKLVAAAFSDEETIRIWDTGNGQPIHQLKGHTGPVNAVTFSPDGKRMATGAADQTVLIWKLGQPSAEKALKQHTAGVQSVAFLPDGKRLISGSDDGTLIVWDIAGASVDLSFSDHEKGVTSVACSPDGKRAASSGLDGTVRLWGLVK